MLFQKKKRLRNLEDSRLFMLTEEHKWSLDSQNELIKQSIDPSENVLQQKLITQSLYSFLLKEARQRIMKKNKL